MKFNLGDKVVVTCADLKAIWMKKGVIVDAFEQRPTSRDFYSVEMDFGGEVQRFTVFENEMEPVA